METRGPATTGADQSAAPADFDVFFEQEHRRLFRALVLACGDREEAEDLAQEAFVRVFERWERVRTMEAPVPYLYAVAFNLHRSGLRRALRWARRPFASPDSGDPTEGVVRRVDVHRALGTLSREQREALILVDWVGLSSEEAGQVLDIEPGAVRARLFRGRRALKEELGPDD